MTSNVSQAANEAFLQELHQADPRRFEKLARVDRTAQALVPTGEGWEVGVCDRCHGSIINAPFVRDGRECCSRSCRDGEAQQVVEHRPLLRRKYVTAGERLNAKRANHAAVQARQRQATSQQAHGLSAR
jgi:hypothetical protein